MLWLLAVTFCFMNCLVIYNEVGNKDTSKELVIMHDIIKKTDDTNHSRQAKNRRKKAVIRGISMNITKKISTCMTNLI